MSSRSSLKPNTATAPEQVCLTGRLLAQWPDLAGRLLSEGLGAVMHDLPEHHYDDDVLPVILGCGHAVLGALAADQVPSLSEVRELVDPVARQHADERLPISALLSAIHLSSQVLLGSAAGLAEPDEIDQLVDLGQNLLQVLSSVNIVVVEAYLDSSPLDAHREARRELCDALINGRPAAGLAARADTVVADSYLVATVLLDVDSDLAPSNLVLSRRTRELRRALDELTSGSTPARFDGVEGVALIAETAAEADAGSPRWSQLARTLTESFGADVYLAFMEGVRPGEIPQAVGDATELARLARVLRRGPGAYRIDDLLLEYQVTRPSPARDRLAERVAPLFSQDHLLETLYAHLEHGADRKRAAAQVHVHPNTYTYRLRRIHEVTGLDAMRPRESRMLATALMVAGRWDPKSSDGRF